MSDLVVLDIDAARRLTERIRRVAQNVAEQVEDLRALVAEAKETEAHVALGYASWTAYLADLFGDEPLRLARDVRRELVAELHDQGMSTRAIAPIVGVDHATVVRDTRGGADAPPRRPVEDVERDMDDPDAWGEPVTPTQHSWDVPGWAAPASEGAPVITPKPITGLDGKNYPAAPTPAIPRRRALTDRARDAGWEIRKAADRLTRIREDDRFSRNKEEVAAHLRSHLTHAVQVCQDLLNGFDQPQED